jgi:hypothetical protein
MKTIFRATMPDDRLQLTDLLTAAFHCQPGIGFRDPLVMAWKYWDARGDWMEPRSYVLERDGCIIAHAGIWPVEFGNGQTAVNGVQMIDWAAARDSPGAGLALVRRLASKFDFMYSIGGSDITRKLLPAFGFVEVTRTWTAARPLRPLRQILTHQTTDWKLGLRFARNWFWSNLPLKRSNVAWKVVGMQPSEIPYDLISNSQAELLSSRRTQAFFQYLLRCPAIKYQLYGVLNESGPQGYLALGILRGQARLAGVWLRNPCEEHWRIAYTLAQETALSLKGAYEIAARGSIGPSGHAATQAGLRIMQNTPVYLLSKKGKFSPEGFEFQLSDDDAAFLDIGKSSYYT